ncbi:MAG: sel1 repeat family protein [Rhodospirillales bacterium]|nr:sel1 repeat family protein [Rhodospirillales bacterium]
MTRRLKRLALIASALTLLGAAPVFAGYEDALKMVREAKYQQAYSEFMPLAEEGHSASQFSMGLLYHLGRGIKQDSKIAYEWYKKAALQSHAPAMNNLGMMYLNGEYVARNQEVAFKLFEKAGGEHAQAKDNLGQCFENGWGVEQDTEMAANLYELAGDGGYVAAYFHAGQLYEKGYPDTPQDIDMAVEWYIKAAEKKYAAARTRLIELKRLPDNLKNQ